MDHEPQEGPDRQRPGFLQRVFAPPVAPLPGKPDPLADFNYRGPARPLMAGLYLLGRNPFAWLLPGMIVGFLHLYVLPATGQGALSLLGSALLYGVLFGAGWFGWQRPWLFGAAASLLGYLVLLGFILSFAATEGVLGQASAAEWSVLLVQGLFFLGIGALAGWFGGYYRRRRADPSYRRPPPRRR